VPPAPPRPSGIERNIVATLWDVGDDHSFMHDQISTDKNHPNVNGGGPNYAVNAGHGQLVVLDQADNNTYALDIPDARSQGQSSFALPVAQPPVDVLGQRAPVVQSSVRSGRPAQPHDRQQGPCVDDIQDSRQHGSGLVQRSEQ
jgi:hypothetical protein